MFFWFLSGPVNRDWRGDDYSLPPQKPNSHDDSLSAFGMWVFLSSLFGLFASLFVLILIERSNAPRWPIGVDRMPAGLWLATGLLISVSVAVQQALRSVRRDRSESLRTWLVISAVLIILFLGVQGINWVALFNRPAGDFARKYLGLFYIFTIFHAVHVLGGLLPITWVTYRAFHNSYTRHHHSGIRNCALYWHFVDAVWLVILPALFWPR